MLGQERTLGQREGRMLLVTPASCITGVKWIVGMSFPPDSTLLTTHCSARDVKQGTPHKGDLQWVGDVYYLFILIQKHKSCSFQRTHVFVFGIKNLIRVLTFPQMCCNWRFQSVWRLALTIKPLYNTYNICTTTGWYLPLWSLQSCENALPLNKYSSFTKKVNKCSKFVRLF